MALFGNLLGPRKQSKDTRRVSPAEGDEDVTQDASSACPAGFIAQQEGPNRDDDDRKDTAGEAELMPRGPVRRQTSSGHNGCSKDSTRPAAENMMNHVKAVRKSLPTLKPGKIVTKKNVQVNLLVVRNPELWLQGDVDGGAGKPGMISAIDEATDTCTVYWYESGQVHDCKIGRKGELCKPCGTIGVDGRASVGMAQSAMEAMVALFRGRGTKKHQTTTLVEPFAQPLVEPFARQISYGQYAEKTQTAIIFDWDDTLFPTSYVKDELGLSIKRHLKDQRLKPQMMSRVQTSLAKAAGAANQLLRLADERGKVVIVTLATSPWVTDSCRYFYPGIGELIEQLNIQVVYAQEGEQIEYKKVNLMAKDQFETFWAERKGNAISKTLSEFYSQYEGQSWKNIISLGDSHFERYGTMAATMQYAASRGLVDEEEVFPTKASMLARARRGSTSSLGSQLSVSNVKRHEIAGQGRRMSWEGTVDGQDVKVRTKTFKLLDAPSVEELSLQMILLHRWLPLMVGLDDGFDVDFNGLDGEAEIDKIENTLRAPEC